MITSTSNARVKRLVNLVKKHKTRNEEGLFVVEGIRMFREVPLEDLKELYVSESFYQKEQAMISKRLAGSHVRPEVLSDTVFAHVSDTKTPQGVLCLISQRKYTLDEVLARAPAQILVLDGLQDPGNLGTILRTGEGAGVTGIVMSSDCVDIYNPKTIRSTMGSIYRMPFCCVSDLPEAIAQMKAAGITTYAAHLEGKLAYDEEDYRSACAFLIGNEGNGLRDAVAESADSYIRIPMCGQVESLNAAIAATVLMFEAARQRRQK